MSSGTASHSAIVKAGMARLCTDFTKLVTPLGFKRTNGRSREWTTQVRDRVWSICFHRSGSTYGAPRNNSIDIRVHFTVIPVDGLTEPKEGLMSDKLRDNRQCAYHLRFNALSWSTYDRCLEDLLRITRDHGMPWFERHGA